MIARIRLRRGTTAQWGSADPVLAVGEVGYDTDTQGLRVGDGVTVWSGLPDLIPDVSDAIRSADYSGIVEVTETEWAGIDPGAPGVLYIVVPDP